MNFICVQVLRKTLTFPVFKNKIILFPITGLKRNKSSLPPGQFPLDNISNLKKDVLLYSFEKTRVFKFLAIFGPAQLVVWVFYAGFLFQNLRDISVSKTNAEEVFTNPSFWRRINLGETKNRIISTILCLGIGLFTTFVCLALPSRIVKELTLFKGGQTASVVTYGLFGRPLKQTVPLRDLSCLTSRSQAKSYVAIKIKKKWFYYLVDCKGQFHQPLLFDYTIGTSKAKAY